jgi:ADP-heptose:LPS heptosyltransferase
MNEQQSRTLDYWLGIALCWLLTRWRRMRDLWRSSPTNPPTKILFIKLSEMGAVALAMPAFEEAARRVGRQNLYCLMLETNREIHDLVRFFEPDHLISIRDRSLPLFAIDAWRMMRVCRREGIDCVIDLEGFARVSALLAYLTGARVRVGMHRYTSEGLYRGDLFTHRVSLNCYNHASVQFLTMVEALDHPATADVLVKERIELADYRLPRFEPTDAERDAMASLLRSGGQWAPGRPLFVLNPNLVDLLPLRRWPRQSWLELGRRLLDQSPEAVVALIGLPKEREFSEALARDISPERAFSLAGQTTIRSLVTLCALADLLVTSDSGPAHMAAFTELPSVTIFGPETPRLYAPLAARGVSLWSGLACSPCLSAFNHRRSACHDNVCTQVIGVDEVLDAARRICPALRPIATPAPN